MPQYEIWLVNVNILVWASLAAIGSNVYLWLPLLAMILDAEKAIMFGA